MKGWWVVSIPENLPLSDSEKSVLSKGLNFGPILTSLFMQKLTKISLSSTKTLSKTRLTIKELNKNFRPLQKISLSPLLELHVFTFYLKSTNLTTQVDPIVSVGSCLTEFISSYLDKIMASIVKNSPSYIKDSQHLQFSVNLISLAKTNLLSQWILRLFILSLP